MTPTEPPPGPHARARYAAAVGFSLAAVLIRALLDPWLEETLPFTIAFGAVAASAWYGGLGPGLLTIALSGGVSVFAFAAPRWTFVVPGRLVPGVAAFAVTGLGVVLMAEQGRRARRRAEAVAREEARQREWLRLALVAGRMGTWDLEAHTRRVAWSPELETIHGLAPGTFPGTFAAYESDLHPDDHDRVVASMNRALTEGVPHHAEYRIVRPDGEPRWIEAHGLPLRDPSGRVARVIGICADVTERKRVEAELRRALEAAEEAGRAKDRFLAMLSHELRTPLAPLLLAADELVADPGLPDRLREAAVTVRQNVALEVRLIDDLLDVSRVVHGKLQYRFEPADAHDLLARAVDVSRADVAAKRIDLVVDPAADRHHVRADPARLQQVFWNLVKNAVKFTPDGGAVRVRTWNEGPPEAPALVVEVADTGVGIDPAALPRIFRAFEQAEDVTTGYGGLGLGLAISRAIAAAHGGELTAESPGRNQGSTFRLTLPVAAPAAPGAGVDGHGANGAGPAGGEGGSAARPLRVLLVEDDPMTARIMARLLRNNGYDVATAGTLAAARSVPAEGLDVVVSDLGLPDGSGLDLMRHVADRSDVPGIALTGFGMEDDLRKTREAGFVAHLTKPVDFARLDAMIRKVVAEHPRAGRRVPSPG